MQMIKLEAAINAVEFGITYATLFDRETGEAKHLFEETNKELKKAIERIKRLPTIELKRLPTIEQMHGTWEILTQDWDGCLVQCSECGSIDTALYPYCHKCGSVMFSKLAGEGEEDDD